MMIDSEVRIQTLYSGRIIIVLPRSGKKNDQYRADRLCYKKRYRLWVTVLML